MQYTAAVITDLDGTLLDQQSKLSEKNLNTLSRLGELGVLRVAATGRSLFSVRKVFNEKAPFEYLVFSTGCGIYDWKNQRLLQSHSLKPHEIKKALKVIQEQELDFMLHAPVPENHWLKHHMYSKENKDFSERIALYKDVSQPINFDDISEKASEILVIAPAEKAIDAFQTLTEACPELSIILVTSPLNHSFAWIEIFSAGVSKSQASQYLMALEDIPEDKIMAIGNDYNDIDLLDWAPYSYIVKNAPEEIKKGHIEVKPHHEDGFTEAVNQWLESK